MIGRLIVLALHWRGSRLAWSLPMLTVVAAGLVVPAQASAIAPTVTLNYTGAEQTYTVPSGVLLEGFVVQGGDGGSDDAQPGSGQDAYGATLQGYLPTTPGQTLYAEVGQNGSPEGGATFGGGGAAGSGLSGDICPDGLPCDGAVAGSGGGASDLRTCSMSAANCPGGGSSLDTRLIVAAGAGGDGGVAAGAECEYTYEIVQPGAGHNSQLPPPGSSGPAPIFTSSGVVIPGYAGGGEASVLTINGTTNAEMGTTAAGAGGSQTGCTVNGVGFSDFTPGSAGSGPDGGAGGSSSAGSGAGGGGGGGYFGGGGGASGSAVCGPTPCSPTNTGEGGAAGSSFISNEAEYPTNTFDQGESEVYIEIWPVIEIDTPANDAVYSPGQVVDAGWDCAGYGQGPGGCDSASATVPSGSPIDTTPGTHTFTVNAKVNVTGDGSQPASGSVTYTVADPPTASIATPADNATYAVGQVVDSSFGCTEGEGGPGISSCLDQDGNASGSPIDTSTPGTYTYVVTATSADGLTGTQTVSYTVAGAPSAAIGTPANGGGYAEGTTVPTSFSCMEGPFGPGLASCIDSNGASGGSGQLDTSSPGPSTYTVTAASTDGQTGSTSIDYTVWGPPTATISAPVSGQTYSVNQVVATSFGCADYAGAPGLVSCTDSNGASANGSAGSGQLTTSSPGTFTYSVTATSLDRLSDTAEIEYTVKSSTIGPPSISILTPSGGAQYTYGSTPRSSFTCTDAAGAPGIKSCRARIDGGAAVSSGAKLVGSVGSHTITVTALSKDGQSSMASASYTVLKAPTTLAAAPQASPGVVSATLTVTGGGPLAGSEVAFTVGSGRLCGAVTNSGGVATCKFGAAKQKLVNAAGAYTATFAGNARYLGSTATATATDLRTSE